MNKRSNEMTVDDRVKRLRRSEEKQSNQKVTITPEIGKYTEGPLDPKFGQHSVFPQIGAYNELQDDESMSVFSYLASVREEAEKDSCVHFAEEKRCPTEKKDELTSEREGGPSVEQGEEELLDATEPSEISPEILENIMTKFLRLKMQIIDSMPSIRSANAQMALPETATQWRALVHHHGPPPIEYFYTVIDHPTAIKLIVYFTKWLCSSSNEYISQWIWRVLLRLDMPLEVNECSLVRDLGKKALKLYQKMNESDSNVAEGDSNVAEDARFTITMVLVIVSEYYGQRDLVGQLRKSPAD